MPGKLIVVSGPSGVGKGTVLKRVLQRLPDLRKSVSVTTRPPAAGEVEGDEYRFVSDDEFAQFVAQDAFLEWAEVHGNRYGTPKAWVDDQIARGVDVVLEIDVQGAMQIAEKRPDARLVFVRPPSREELERRIRARKRDDEAAVRRRMRQSVRELELSSCYPHQVVNDDLECAVEEVCRIITGR